MLLERCPRGANRRDVVLLAETPEGVFGNPFTSSTHVTPLLIRSSCAFRHSIFKEQAKNRPPLPGSSFPRNGQGDGLHLPPLGLFPRVSPKSCRKISAAPRACQRPSRSFFRSRRASLSHSRITAYSADEVRRYPIRRVARKRFLDLFFALPDSWAAGSGRWRSIVALLCTSYAMVVTSA